MALINKLTAIANAIRNKTGKSDLLTLEQMPIEIAAIETGGGGEGLPEEAYLITGNCSYRFSNGGWDWFLRNYWDKIKIEGVTNASYMFSNCELEELPTPMKFDNTTYRDFSYMFDNCRTVQEIAKITDAYPAHIARMFNQCWLLYVLPEFENLNLDRVHTYTSINACAIFYGCYSLRQIPEEFLKELYAGKTSSYVYSHLYLTFQGCYSLDEIRGLSPKTAALSSNAFSGTFTKCTRIKELIFDTQEDGTPYTAQWKNQTIDLGKNQYIGYDNGLDSCTMYANHGITTAKKVSNDATYAALKDDPNWYAETAEYSRYNHTSAVNTINSLPDTSAYGTNTIKFLGTSGSKTDGGAISNLTEEEIAVAAAKGWTVTLT